MLSLQYIRKHCKKISLGDSFPDRMNRAYVHFLMLLIDKKLEWHCRGIFREFRFKKIAAF